MEEVKLRPPLKAVYGQVDYMGKLQSTIWVFPSIVSIVDIDENSSVEITYYFGMTNSMTKYYYFYSLVEIT